MLHHCESEGHTRGRVRRTPLRDAFSVSREQTLSAINIVEIRPKKSSRLS